MRKSMQHSVATILIFFACVSSHTVYAKECVVLLHGLARTSLSMLYIEKQLEGAGYIVVNKSYPSRKNTIAELAKDVVPNAIKACPTNTRVHFVTHSMGGIVLRQYFADLKQTEELSSKSLNVGRIVMLAPPTSGALHAGLLGQRLRI